MNCPQCGSRWKVSDSRHADSPRMSGGLTNWIDEVAEKVDWYTNDWVARRRKCVKCGFEQKTIEVTLQDLEEILKGRDAE